MVTWGEKAGNIEPLAYVSWYDTPKLRALVKSNTAGPYEVLTVDPSTLGTPDNGIMEVTSILGAVCLGDLGDGGTHSHMVFGWRRRCNEAAPI